MSVGVRRLERDAEITKNPNPANSLQTKITRNTCAIEQVRFLTCCREGEHIPRGPIRCLSKRVSARTSYRIQILRDLWEDLMKLGSL